MAGKDEGVGPGMRIDDFVDSRFVARMGAAAAPGAPPRHCAAGFSRKARALSVGMFVDLLQGARVASTCLN